MEKEIRREHDRLEEASTTSLTLGEDAIEPLTAIRGDDEGAKSAGQTQIRRGRTRAT